MLKLRVFLNEPMGKTWMAFMQTIPSLGEKYKLEIETLSKPREYFRTTEYSASGLPAAPAIMLRDEILIQGGAISEEALESAIRRHLGIL